MPTILDALPEEFLVNRRVSYGGNTDVPQFVLDCLEADPDTIRRLHPDAQARPRALQTLMSTGALRVLDRATAEPRPRDRTVVLSVPCLGLADIIIREEILERAPALLDGGCWALIDLVYQPAGSSVPYAVVNVEVVRTVLGDPEKFATTVGKIDPEPWERLLVQSIGFQPDAFTARQRLILLSRLAPLVESNLHLVELGQPGTGKSTTLVATSARTIVKTGGQVSLPELFKNLRTGLPGLIARYDLVGLDEIQHMDVTGGDTVTAALKEYLESGTYTRGGITGTSQASLCFMGNIPIKEGLPDPAMPYLFSVLPRPLHDVALFDRLHGALPDWELPTIAPTHIYAGRAVALDILAEYFHHQRRTSYADLIASSFDWAEDMTQRDVRAVARMSSALLKLRFPARGWHDEALRETVTFASELRQRVYNSMVGLRGSQYAPRIIGFAGMEPHRAPDVKDPLVRRDIIGPGSAAVGCVLGLAAHPTDLTSGEVFAIEAGLVPGRPGPEMTGLHGRVLDDSLKTAWAYITTHEAELGLPHAQVQSQRVHVHLKRAWQKREGPSAGAAIVAAMVSALTDRPARQSVAVTGAVSLKGDILEVGAVPAKVVAAFRHGCSTVIIPRENAGDLARIPSHVADAMQVVLVDRAEEVIEALLLPREGSA